MSPHRHGGLPRRRSATLSLALVAQLGTSCAFSFAPGQDCARNAYHKSQRSDAAFKLRDHDFVVPWMRSRTQCAAASGEHEAFSSLQLLPRRELQALAKTHGIKANLKTTDIIQALVDEGVTAPSVDASSASDALDIGTEDTRKDLSGGGDEVVLLDISDGEFDLNGEDVDDDAAAANVPWTEERCTRRLSVLQRKLRQVQELVSVPESELDDQQRAKLERREALVLEIADMEQLRRVVREDAAAGKASARRGTRSLSVVDDEEDGADALSDAELLRASFAAATGEEGGEDAADPMQLPKRLLSTLTYCRVSARETCEALIAMGRVTVNGNVTTAPSTKVDIMKDEIVANGMRVTLPPVIDNAELAASKMAEFAELQQRSGSGPASRRLQAGDDDSNGREGRPPQNGYRGSRSPPSRGGRRDGGDFGERRSASGSGWRGTSAGPDGNFRRREPEFGRFSRESSNNDGERGERRPRSSWRDSNDGYPQRRESSSGGYGRRSDGGDGEGRPPPRYRDGPPRRDWGSRDDERFPRGGRAEGRGGGSWEGRDGGRDGGRRTRPSDGRRDAAGPLPKSERSTYKQSTRVSWKVDGGLLARKTRGIRPKGGNFIDKDTERKARW